MSEQPAARKVIPIQPLFKSEPKIHPRSVKGLFQNWRWAMVWLTQLVFYGLCWLPWHGRQAVLFDIDRHRFYLFDLVLWPQDTIYLAVLLVLAALALFLFTAVAGRLAGRVWCGYTCPQTVYTEVFLWIEERIEGERSKRIKLDAGAWSADKLRKKVLKHSLWLLLSLWTGFTFVGYFTPVRELAREIVTLSPGAWEAFWVLFYAAATYGNAGFLREQMCKYICPYARFQFVMFDSDTLIITYDEARGEPRGGRSKKADPRQEGLGDCVDCGICVQVCPTGIDIRHGLQAECIGCAACIDACDQVMDKLSYPRGLIRYSTENALAGKFAGDKILRRAFRPRTLVYAAVFVVLSGATAWSLLTRQPLTVDVVRDRAVLAREADDGSVDNNFHVQLVNASEEARSFTLAVEGLDGIHLAQPVTMHVPAAAAAGAMVTVTVAAGPATAGHGAQPFRFVVVDSADARVQVVEKARFWLP
jgi:cytochrome c oxidase accessory protein FixG